MSMKTIFRVSMIVLASVFIGFMGTAQADELSDVKASVQKTQEENESLRRQVEQQNQTMQALLQRIETLERAKAAPAQPVMIAPVVKSEDEAGDMLTPHTGFIPKLKWKGFADVGLNVNFKDKEDNSTFSLGMIDLFLTSELTDRISFLLETVFDFETDTNEGRFEMERAVLKYSLSDAIKLYVGRFHAPFGYWNQTFHHGSWLHTSVTRPQIYLFEDQLGGGFLPVHAVGGFLSGTKNFAPLDLEYDFGISNGRGRTKAEVQNVQDKNDSKAVQFRLAMKPVCLEGFQIGTSVYVDKIPTDPDSGGTNRVNELIVGGFSVYNTPKLELLGEAFNVYHKDKSSGIHFDSLGFYLQAGYKMHPWTPFYRFDFIDFAQGDPFYGSEAFDIMKHTTGLRWDITTWNALKFEYGHAERKNSENEHSFIINSSFTF